MYKKKEKMLLLPQKSLNPTPQSYPRTIKVTEFLWDLPEIEGTHTVIGEKKKNNRCHQRKW